jgi:hypothetical protein
MTSADIGELAKALAAAQGEFPPIPKDCVAKVTTRGGQSYSFKYADLETILAIVRPVLAKHGLAITVNVEACEVKLPEGRDKPSSTLGMAATVRLLHMSGQWMESRPLAVPVDPEALGRQYAQAVGSSATYATRYAIEAALAIRATEDTDGSEASGNATTVERAPMKTPPKPAPKPEPPAKPASQMHPDLMAVLQEFHWPDGHKTEFANKLLANYGTTLAECTKSAETGKAAAFAINGQVKNWLEAHPDETRADALQTLFASIMEKAQ